MEQGKPDKDDIARFLLTWEEPIVRVHVSSYGVGVNHRGYLYLALDGNKISSGVNYGELLPDIVFLYHKKQGIPRSEWPFVTVNLDDFTEFQIIEDNANQLVFMKNPSTPIEVLIERIV